MQHYLSRVTDDLSRELTLKRARRCKWDISLETAEFHSAKQAIKGVCAATRSRSSAEGKWSLTFHTFIRNVPL